jgi:DNA repair protein RadD
MVRRPRRNAGKPLARVAAAEIELNCMVLTQGWDMPEVGCCILARPTKKMGCSAR